MKFDIATTIRTAFVLMLVGALFIFVAAYRRYQESQRILFYLKRRALTRHVIIVIMMGVIVVIAAIIFNNIAEPIIYNFYSPSPTITLTPTASLVPTITLTPTMTLTPIPTRTPLFTSTPMMPAVISKDFMAKITPNPDSIFSPITFSRKIDKNLRPLQPVQSFQNPIKTIYGTFSYDKMVPGSQWSALWFRNGELINYESIPWNGASGGYGYTNIPLSPEEWLPGSYEVRIYVGEIWKVTSYFDVTGNPLTPTFTLPVIPSKTITPTFTVIPRETQTLTPKPIVTIEQ
jgi:hypothetical protein